MISAPLFVWAFFRLNPFFFFCDPLVESVLYFVILFLSPLLNGCLINCLVSGFWHSALIFRSWDTIIWLHPTPPMSWSDLWDITSIQRKGFTCFSVPLAKKQEASFYWMGQEVGFGARRSRMYGWVASRGDIYWVSCKVMQEISDTFEHPITHFVIWCNVIFSVSSYANHKHSNQNCAVAMLSASTQGSSAVSSLPFLYSAESSECVRTKIATW